MRNIGPVIVLLSCIGIASARPERAKSLPTDSHPLDGKKSKDNEPVIPSLEVPGNNARNLDANLETDGTSRRNIVHKSSYDGMDLSMELFRETLSRHLGRSDAKSDPCRYMRCGPGQECEVLEDGAKCVCRRHCKQRNKPLCGTDDEYYDNHCEMHRAACLTGRDIYDARHKDCFYRASTCNRFQLAQYKDILLQYYKNLITSTNLNAPESKEHTDTKSSQKAIKRRRRSIVNSKKRGKVHRQDELDVLSEESDVVFEKRAKLENLEEKIEGLSEVGESPRFDIEAAVKAAEFDHDVEIMTKDQIGDLVKYIFTLLDLDSNKKVGSDEVWEISSLQRLENVLPGPCTLFHLLKLGDINKDRILDLSETFKLFNITVFRLPRSDRYARKSAVYGKPAELQCGIEGEPEPLWQRYGHKLDERNGIRIGGRTLHLDDVTARNGGNFTCSARTRPEMLQTIHVEVMTVPSVRVHPRSQHPTSGSSATIKCFAEARPIPDVVWKRNGEDLDMTSGRYILMAESTELHFNTVDEEDSAAYSCMATNKAGVGEDVASIYVVNDNSGTSHSDSPSVYFVFHRDGISVVDPHLCQTMRNIPSKEKIPGLFVNDHLCGLNANEQRECVWSNSISVGSRYIYAAQPTEDRLVVVDKELQRIVEVITTDLMPVELFYVPSTDQVFVLCWVDENRNSSVLQVIHSAGVAGKHAAEHIRPISQHNRRLYDRSVYRVFIAPESPLNPRSQFGFILHKNEPAIQRLHLDSLTYSSIIDLSLHECIPLHLSYLPIGGLLHVTCQSVAGKPNHFVTVDIETDSVINVEEGYGMTEEYLSSDYKYAVRLYPEKDMITVHNISSGGKIQEIMVIRTNFAASDVHFVHKKYNPASVVAYMVAKNQGDVMYIDLDKKKVEILDGLTPPVVGMKWPWSYMSRKMSESEWSGWFLATSGRTGMEIIGLNTNQVLCRLNEFVEATAISWSHGEF